MVRRTLNLVVAGLLMCGASGACSGANPEDAVGQRAKAGALDKLDPAKIPQEERFPFQPKELVGVLRVHRAEQDGYGGGWIALSPDGKWLLHGGGSDAIVRFFSVDRLEPVAALEGHTKLVLAVAFAPDSKLAVTAGGDRSIRVWDLSGAKPRERTTLVGHDGIIWGVAFSADGKQVASAGGGDHSAKVWDVSGEQARLRMTVANVAADAYSVAFLAGDKLLAAAGADGTIRIYDITGKQPTGPFTLNGHEAEGVYPMLVSPDGKLLATADHNRTGNSVRLWDLTGNQPKEKAVLKAESKGYASLAFSPDGKLLAATSHGDSRKVVVWEVGTSKLLYDWQFPHAMQGVSFAADGRHLAAASSRGAVYFLRLSR